MVVWAFSGLGCKGAGGSGTGGQGGQGGVATAGSGGERTDAHVDARPTADRIGAPDAAARGCESVTCSGIGTCFVDDGGVARCDCNTSTTCDVPTPNLACVPAWQPCLDGGITCGAPAACDPGIDECCRLEPNPGVLRCTCNRGFRYDGTTCVEDVSNCAALPCLVNTTPSTRQWDIQATGDATVEIVDEGNYDRYWDSDGNLGVYNHYQAPQCGSFAFSGGLSTQTGTFPFSTGPLIFELIYPEKAYFSRTSGVQGVENANGTMVINQLSWCADFECSIVDITLDGMLTASDGSQVHAQGFIKGQMF